MILNLDTVKSITCGVNRLEETDNGIRFHRMTEEEENYYYNRYTDPTIALRWLKKAKSNSGVTLKFRTDAKTLYTRFMIEWSSIRSFYCFEFFCNEKRIDTLQNFKDEEIPTDYAGITLPPRAGLVVEKELLLEEGEKEIEIVLPWNHSVLLQEIRLSDNAFVSPAEKRGLLLAYGDSITHGADALYPSGKYVTLLARALNLEERNKGVSAEEFRPKFAELAEDLKPALITVAYGTNDWSWRTKEVIHENARQFLTTLKEKYPSSPIVVFSPLWRADFEKKTPFGSFENMKTMMEEIAKDLGLYFIPCNEFLPHRDSVFSDLRLHPSNEGFVFYFEGIMKKLKELNLC